MDNSRLREDSLKRKAEWMRYFRQHKKKLEKMDPHILVLHDRYSAEIDCLSCGNCCRTLGPRITGKDVEKMAKALRMKPGQVVEQYLRIDEDGDMVFRSMPCPFLGDDNYCAIYESRPKACREYPHTDRRKFFQIFSLSVKNAETCPIVYKVLDGIVAGE